MSVDGNRNNIIIMDDAVPPTVGSTLQKSAIPNSPDDQVDLPKLGYSPDSPVTKLVKPKCPNTSHM